MQFETEVEALKWRKVHRRKLKGGARRRRRVRVHVTGKPVKAVSNA